MLESCPTDGRRVSAGRGLTVSMQGNCLRTAGPITGKRLQAFAFRPLKRASCLHMQQHGVHAELWSPIILSESSDLTLGSHSKHPHPRQGLTLGPRPNHNVRPGPLVASLLVFSPRDTTRSAACKRPDASCCLVPTPGFSMV